MAIGGSAIIAHQSYWGVAREKVLGTFITATAALPFKSLKMKTMKDGKIVEQIEMNRAYSQRVEGGKKIEGDAEFLFYPMEAAPNYILQNAFGGAISSATATGDTVGSAAWTHTISIGMLDGSYSSLSFNIRKGDSVGAKNFQYNGVRVNKLSFSAEVDSALTCKASFIGMDSTSGGTDISSTLTIGAQSFPLTFVNGRISVENSLASLTTSSFWHVQKMEFGISNNLKDSSESRRIGSDTLQVLPLGMATFDLKLSMRYDTLTAYNAMINSTNLSAEFEFLGPTITGSKIRQGLKITMPNVYVQSAGDPEIGGPDEILKSDVTFHILRDATSATGYAVKAFVTNGTASYS